MRGKLSTFLIFIALISCSDENLPPKLYDYQVERLLSGGDSKIWNQIVNSESCQDSVKLLIRDENDSLDVYRLAPDLSCDFTDTTSLGRADASSFAGGILFTDSLIFANGDFWIVQSITSDLLSIEIGTEIRSFQSH